MPKPKRTHDDKTDYELATRKAIRGAMEQCIQNGVLVDFLTERSSEIEEMLYAQFAVELVEQALFEDGHDEEKAMIATTMLENINEGESREDVIGQLQNMGISQEIIDGALDSLDLP